MYSAILNHPLNLKPLDRYYAKGDTILIKDFLEKCLNKNPAKRPSANELLNHPWIKIMVEEESIDASEQVLAVQNLAAYKDATLFQTSVVTFLVRLKTDKEDISALRRLFTKVDSNHDGFLQPDEI